MNCSIKDCFSPAAGRGWCHKHYKRWQVHGDPEKIVNRRIHHMSVKDRVLLTIKVDTITGCWNWIGSINKQSGRGRLKVKCRTTVAYRASYEAFIGDIPFGKMVCHTCDNPLCVNPWHLFTGSAKDNIQDSVRKNRHPKHERHNKAKLTMKIADDIRARKLTAKQYASIYEIHWSSVYNIWRGVTWINSNQRKGNI